VDGQTNTVTDVSSNAYSTNLISQITDPFGRSANLGYSSKGLLTNIVDSAGLTNGLAYDQTEWVTNLVTPYGRTVFQLTGSSGASVPLLDDRSVRVLEPDGSCQLFVYKNSASGVASSYSSSEVPITSPFANTFAPAVGTNLSRAMRNISGAVNSEISTYSVGGTVYLRTNSFSYDSNEIDLLTASNALGVQVSSNSYNAYHQVLTQFNALSEA